jgi:hypothetical protein
MDNLLQDLRDALRQRCACQRFRITWITLISRTSLKSSPPPLAIDPI